MLAVLLSLLKYRVAMEESEKEFGGGRRKENRRDHQFIITPPLDQQLTSPHGATYGELGMWILSFPGSVALS
jgi:hypothetical protein